MQLRPHQKRTVIIVEERSTKEYRAGVGMMVLNAHNQVLLCRRATIPIGWQMPQGGINEGEEPRTAALRELKEEIGTSNVDILKEAKDWRHYDLPADLARQSWDGRYAGQRHKWYLMRFRGHDAEIDLISKHPEFDAWMWALPDHVPNLVVAFKQAMYMSVLQEFREAIRSLPRPAMKL